MKRNMHKHETELADLETPEALTGSPDGPQPVQESHPAEESGEPVTRAEFDQLKGERDQLLDRLARMQAEFDNARKRAERERVEFRDIDNFQLALSATSNADQLRSGVALIVKQMEETLQKLQVSVIPSVGQPFDPRVHEALGSVERDDIPDQHVADEIRRGYRLRDRLLRPALVRVAHNPKQISE